MLARYAKSYVDQLYQAKDVFALHGVIGVVGRQRQLPEQFSVFTRLWEWCCSTRSGIWQYYECLPAHECESFAGVLERFELRELAERYRAGVSTWQEPDRCGELDRWIDEHWCELEAAAFRLIADSRDCLYDDET
jgi:hypothetical protein